MQTRADVFLKSLIIGIAEAVPKLSEVRSHIDNLFDNPQQGSALLGADIYDELNRDARWRTVGDSYGDVAIKTKVGVMGKLPEYRLR